MPPRTPRGGASGRVRVRLAAPPDAAGVAAVSSVSFCTSAADELGSDRASLPPLTRTLADAWDADFRRRMARDVFAAVGRSLARRQECTAAARAATALGVPAPRRSREGRCWALLVADIVEEEDGRVGNECVGDVSAPRGNTGKKEGGRGAPARGLERSIAGTLTFSIAVPDAPLPPPWPAMGRQKRAYASNVAVSPAARRKGVASALLSAAERRAARLGYDELWLHVDQVSSYRLSAPRGASRQMAARACWRQQLLTRVMCAAPNARAGQRRRAGSVQGAWVRERRTRARHSCCARAASRRAEAHAAQVPARGAMGKARTRACRCARLVVTPPRTPRRISASLHNNTRLLGERRIA